MQTWVTKSAAEQHSTIPLFTGLYLGLSGLGLFVFSIACIQFTLGIAPRISLEFHTSLAKALLS